MEKNIINFVFEKVLQYQKENNIIKQCVCNSLIFKHIIEQFTSQKVKLEIVTIYYPFEGEPSQGVHVVPMINNEILEVSYDFSLLPDEETHYVSFNDWLVLYDNIPEEKKFNELKKGMEEEYAYFKKIIDNSTTKGPNRHINNYMLDVYEFVRGEIKKNFQIQGL